MAAVLDILKNITIEHLLLIRAIGYAVDISYTTSAAHVIISGFLYRP